MHKKNKPPAFARGLRKTINSLKSQNNKTFTLLYH